MEFIGAPDDLSCEVLTKKEQFNSFGKLAAPDEAPAQRAKHD